MHPFIHLSSHPQLPWWINSTASIGADAAEDDLKMTLMMTLMIKNKKNDVVEEDAAHYIVDDDDTHDNDHGNK